MKKLKVILYFDTFEQAAELGYFDAKQDKKTKRWCKEFEVNYCSDYYIEDDDNYHMGSYEL